MKRILFNVFCYLITKINNQNCEMGIKVAKLLILCENTKISWKIVRLYDCMKVMTQNS